jgi:hypothetical protein
MTPPFGQGVTSWNDGGSVVVATVASPSPAGTVDGGSVVGAGGGNTGSRMSRPSSLQAVASVASSADPMKAS